MTMLASLIARLAAADAVRPVLRLTLVQRLTQLLFGRVQFPVAVEAYGFTLLVDVFNVRVYSEIKAKGAYESKMSRRLASLLRPGMNVCDIGANIGYYTLLAAKGVGKQGRVFAVEPDPSCLDLLRRNLAANGVMNVEVLEACLGEAEGDTILYRTLVNDGNSVVRANILERAYPMHVRSATLDQLVRARAIQIDLIKMDTQGAELSCLRAAQQTLKNPTIQLFVEFWPYGLRNAGENPEDLIVFLLERGFDVDTVEFEGSVTEGLSAQALVQRLEKAGKRNPYEGYVNLHAYRRR